MPFRNAAATLAECLDSIAAQTLSAWELLAIDDGSSDDSASMVRERAAVDGRIRLIQPGRIGLVAALNLGLQSALAPLVARMDADDIMLPERLAAQCEMLRREPQLDLVGTQVELFPAEAILAGYREYVRWQNGCLTAAEIAGNIYVESPLAHPSVMFRRAAILNLGGYRDGPFPEDYDLWLRLHAAGGGMAKVASVLLRWRESSDRTSRVDERYSREAFDRLRAECLACDPRIHQPLSGGGSRPLVIWGAGRKTRQRVRLLLQRGIAATAWIDINPRKIGRSIWGLPVHAPAWLANRGPGEIDAVPPRPFVLVYVTNHGARDEITDQLHAWGFRIGDDYLAVG